MSVLTREQICCGARVCSFSIDDGLIVSILGSNPGYPQYYWYVVEPAVFL